ncbi:MAG: enoyl-CoA hydratase-related protein [Janthinobacterium lividum]
MPSLADMPLSTISHDGHVAVISMAAPAKRNTLSLAMIKELSSAFDRLRAARAVVLRSVADATVWCAGFDIGALSPGFDPLAQDGDLQGLFRRIQDHPAPVIAMLHGSAWGGGTDLALRCDILIGDPTCTLAFTPARLGLPYDADGLLNVVMRAGPAVALEMFSTADPVPAERALRLGLLNHLVPEAELEAFTLAMARRIAGNAPLSVTSAKQQVRALATAIALSSATAQRFAEGRQKALQSHDFGEGLAAFHARRPPDFQGR